jgi:hypothetical protein
MLQFFSASTNIVNSKRAITECLENALEGQVSLDCDLIIIYSAIGHNFKELLTEARNLSPSARIVGCTGSGIIGREGPDESIKALAIMIIKGSKNEFAIAIRTANLDINPYEMAAEMAGELKNSNPGITFIQFLPTPNRWLPIDEAIEGIKSVFGHKIPIFGGIPMDNNKGITCFHFFDDQVVEKDAAIMVGFADPTLKIISKANHGFDIIEGMSLEITGCDSNVIYEFNGVPAWNKLTETLGIPDTSYFMEALAIAGFARELPEELWEECGSKYGLFTLMGKNEDGSLIVPVTCHEGMKIRLTKRDEKKMFDGVECMVKKILDELAGRKPVAVFHSDCAGRGRFSLNLLRKEEIINLMQSPLCGNDKIPWLGLYSGGEFAMLGGQPRFHQMSSALFVIYR